MNTYRLSERISLWAVDRDRPNRGMLLDFIENQARQLPARRRRPETPEAQLRRAGDLRQSLNHSLGLAGFTERPAFQAEVVGRIERRHYVIEKLIYEARPGFPVSAHLYLPRQAPFPVPAVLYAPGHVMANGKLEPHIQVFCANLAQRGMAALVYDAIGQVECWGDWLDHGHLELLLVGLSQAGLMVWGVCGPLTIS